MLFDLSFLFVGLFAAILLVALLVMLGRGDVQKGPGSPGQAQAPPMSLDS